MAILIKWTREANKTFDKNIAYLQNEWTEKEIKNFISQTEFILSRISENPEMYRPSIKGSNVRRVNINRHITLYYQFNSDNKQIFLLTFWHKNRDPKKLKY